MVEDKDLELAKVLAKAFKDFHAVERRGRTVEWIATLAAIVIIIGIIAWSIIRIVDRPWWQVLTTGAVTVIVLLFAGQRELARRAAARPIPKLTVPKEKKL